MQQPVLQDQKQAQLLHMKGSFPTLDGSTEATGTVPKVADVPASVYLCNA